MTVTVTAVNTPLATRLVSIECCDQKSDSGLSSTSVTAATTTSTTAATPITRHITLDLITHPPSR